MEEDKILFESDFRPSLFVLFIELLGDMFFCSKIQLFSLSSDRGYVFSLDIVFSFEELLQKKGGIKARRYRNERRSDASYWDEAAIYIIKRELKCLSLVFVKRSPSLNLQQQRILRSNF